MIRATLTLTILLLVTADHRAACFSDDPPTLASGSNAPGQKTDESIMTVSCVLGPDSSIDPARIAEDNAVKLALYDAAVSKKGVVKAKKICSSIEGDPIPKYVTVKEGKAKVTHDYSRDRRGAGAFKFLPRIFKGIHTPPIG